MISLFPLRKLCLCNSPGNVQTFTPQTRSILVQLQCLGSSRQGIKKSLKLFVAELFDQYQRQLLTKPHGHAWYIAWYGGWNSQHLPITRNQLGWFQKKLCWKNKVIYPNCTYVNTKLWWVGRTTTQFMGRVSAFWKINLHRRKKIFLLL